MAGASAERQENAVVKAVKDSVKKNKNNPITVIAGNTKLNNISDARKYNGRQSSGSEPYTDVIFDTKNSKSINLSLKGESAPSLAGGGLRGLEAIVPGLASKFMKASLKKLLEMGLQPGDKVPDVYGKIVGKTKEKIVIGTQAMGGPIDYMYIGGMDVKFSYDEKSKTLTFKNGNLTESKQYAKTHDLYFRLRARRVDQTFDPEASQGGVPKIYGKSPTRGDSAGRIVVTDSVPKNAVIVQVK
jgi:hypothetical protein